MTSAHLSCPPHQHENSLRLTGRTARDWYPRRLWRSGRVAEGARLLSGSRGLTSSEGSNPSFSVVSVPPSLMAETTPGGGLRITSSSWPPQDSLGYRDSGRLTTCAARNQLWFGDQVCRVGLCPSRAATSSAPPSWVVLPWRVDRAALTTCAARNQLWFGYQVCRVGLCPSRAATSSAPPRFEFGTRMWIGRLSNPSFSVVPRGLAWVSRLG